jgi:hypothetical protein
MLRSRILLCGSALALAAVMALPVQAASKRRDSAQQAQASQAEDATTARLNEESLQRARQGMDAPSPGPDTTSNLNRASEQDARRGRSMHQAPMPFR